MTEGAIALTAATAKTVLNLIAAANRTLWVVEFELSFDGVTAAAAPVLVEVMRSTQATAGTFTAGTVRQERGQAAYVAGSSVGKNYTVEPTVLTPIREFWADPYKGRETWQFPLGREPESLAAATGQGIAFRLTAPAAVNVRAGAAFEE